MFLSKLSSRQNIKLLANTQRNFSKLLKSFATVDPENLSKTNKGFNLIKGQWQATENYTELLDPMNGQVMCQVPNTQYAEQQVTDLVEDLQNTPKSGLHNPFKNKERYLMLGEVNRRLVESMQDPEVYKFFVRLLQRTCPKSYTQADGELKVTVDFFKNFCGDNVRYLASGQRSPGDHAGQFATGYRFPYGASAVITPFNFPLEIPVLQMMGALYMGNKVVVKPDTKTALPLEQFIRLLHECGLPKEDLSFIHADGPTTEKILINGDVRQTLFTGSSRVAEHLCKKLHGKVRIEDAGFDWKIIGPDVPKTQQEIDYVAWQCDQDAYGHSGQKCSAQSILFVHKNWTKKTNLFKTLEQQAGKRNLKDLTIGPILTWNNTQIKEHIDACLQIPGAQILFGGKPLENHQIPEIYGSYQPTAVTVPIQRFKMRKNAKTLLTELFGPFQVIVEYKEIDDVLQVCEQMTHHLTAAVVSNDPVFTDYVLQNTVNGCTYHGMRARTTGAPQNHWFGPSGDPRGAGIGTAEAIQLVWSHHREIVSDVGPIKADWAIPDPK